MTPGGEEVLKETLGQDRDWRLLCLCQCENTKFRENAVFKESRSTRNHRTSTKRIDKRLSKQTSRPTSERLLLNRKPKKWNGDDILLSLLGEEEERRYNFSCPRIPPSRLRSCKTKGRSHDRTNFSRAMILTIAGRSSLASSYPRRRDPIRRACYVLVELAS
uniref:Uncharacterized protein n=1 Tax=Cannabis sativa TaxID=3483 RepID=A0A803PRI0_CANSA